MPLRIPLDSSTPAQLANAVVTNLSAQEAPAIVRVLEQRYPHVDWRQLISGVQVGGAPGARTEWQALLRAGQAWGCRALGAAGGAGNSSFVQLFNPPNSSVRALVYFAQLNNDSPGAQFVLLGTDNVDRGGAVQTQNLRGDTLSSVCKFVGGTALAFASSVPYWAKSLPTLTGADVISGQGWLSELQSGQGLDIISGTNNSAVSGCFWWAEVPLDYR